jgi:hypothetical protein
MGQTAFVEKARAEGAIRQLDCIDCHNRTAHYIPFPEQAIDKAITDGLISPELPFVRSKAVGILQTPYKTDTEAFAAIDALREYYSAQPMETVSKEKKEKMTVDVITTLKNLYTSSNFPYMNLTWDTNPNNERHNPSMGCFRCHDDKHVVISGTGGNGETISGDCNQCHTVPIVGRGTEMLVESPVIVGNTPASHADFRWTIEHRSVTETDNPSAITAPAITFHIPKICSLHMRPNTATKAARLAIPATKISPVRAVIQQVCSKTPKGKGI